jgi:hypothetical protein
MGNTVFHKRAITQLDALVLFMTLRDRRFFKQLVAGWEQFFPREMRVRPPSKHQDYEQLILQSALLLGVAHSEAYLTDVLRAVFCREPRILAVREKQVSWERVTKAADLDELIGFVVDAELAEFTRRSLGDMFVYLRERLRLELPDATILTRLREAGLVRNLITHKGAVADMELQGLNPHFRAGRPIRLTAEMVHRYGLAGRDLIGTVDSQITRKFFTNGRRKGSKASRPGPASRR